MSVPSHNPCAGVLEVPDAFAACIEYLTERYSLVGVDAIGIRILNW